MQTVLIIILTVVNQHAHFAHQLIKLFAKVHVKRTIFMMERMTFVLLVQMQSLKLFAVFARTIYSQEIAFAYYATKQPLL